VTPCVTIVKALNFSTEMTDVKVLLLPKEGLNPLTEWHKPRSSDLADEGAVGQLELEKFLWGFTLWEKRILFSWEANVSKHRNT
jgi:hypothetical protein